MMTKELPSNGVERITTRRVVFSRSFTLGKAPEVYPPGVYQLENAEQPIEAGGHTAYVRTSTVLVIPTASGTYCREVRSSEFEGAVLRDAEQGPPEESSENLDRAQAESKAVLP